MHAAKPPAAIGRRAALALGAAGAVAALAACGSQDEGPPELVARVRFGAYAANEPYPVAPHFALEEALGVHLPVCSWFVAFGQPWLTDQASVAVRHGRYDLTIAWEPHGVRFDDLLAGRHDQYIRDFLDGAGSYPGQVVMRPFHESNGTWYDWAPGSRRGFVRNTGQWRDAWRHVVDAGRRVSRPNVRFLWCMNAPDVPGGAALEDLWPGAESVDLVGADLYDHGEGLGFDARLSPAYRRITALDREHEFWVPEIGTRNRPGRGPVTFTQSVYRSRSFPRLNTLLWFSGRDYVLTDDPAVMSVQRSMLAQSSAAG